MMLKSPVQIVVVLRVVGVELLDRGNGLPAREHREVAGILVVDRHPVFVVRREIVVNRVDYLVPVRPHPANADHQIRDVGLHLVDDVEAVGAVQPNLFDEEELRAFRPSCVLLGQGFARHGVDVFRADHAAHHLVEEGLAVAFDPLDDRRPIDALSGVLDDEREEIQK